MTLVAFDVLASEDLLAVPSTTNVALTATATASSESTGTGQTADKAIDGVIDGYPGDYSKEWASNGEGVGAWLQLDWASPVTISRVVIYERKNAEHITSGTLSFSSGADVAVGEPPDDGSALETAFSSRTVTWLRFTVATVSAAWNIGLMEIEVFSSTSVGVAFDVMAVPGAIIPIFYDRRNTSGMNQNYNEYEVWPPTVVQDIVGFAVGASVNSSGWFTHYPDTHLVFDTSLVTVAPTAAIVRVATWCPDADWGTDLTICLKTVGGASASATEFSGPWAGTNYLDFVITDMSLIALEGTTEFVVKYVGNLPEPEYSLTPWISYRYLVNFHHHDEWESLPVPELRLTP
jgi:hypothetical protein